MRKYLLLPAQAAVMAAATFVSAILPYMLYGQVDSGVIVKSAQWLQWTLVPLSAGVTAYFLTRRGINRYLCWLLPPAVYTALPWAVRGYAPLAGVMLVTCLTGVVGAAAGEVKNQTDQDK